MKNIGEFGFNNSLQGLLAEVDHADQNLLDAAKAF